MGNFCRLLGDGQLLGVKQCCSHDLLANHLLRHSFLIPKSGHLKIGMEQRESLQPRRPYKGVQDPETQRRRARAKREPGWRRQEVGNCLLLCVNFLLCINWGKTEDKRRCEESKPTSDGGGS